MPGSGTEGVGTGVVVPLSGVGVSFPGCGVLPSGGVGVPSGVAGAVPSG